MHARMHTSKYTNHIAAVSPPRRQLLLGCCVCCGGGVRVVLRAREAGSRYVHCIVQLRQLCQLSSLVADA